MKNVNVLIHNIVIFDRSPLCRGSSCAPIHWEPIWQRPNARADPAFYDTALCIIADIRKNHPGLQNK